MPSATYTPLANITLTGTAASVTFSSISQAYRDLVLVIKANGTDASRALQVLVNADSGANYNNVSMGGNGTTASSTSNSGSSALGPYYYSRVTSGVGYQAVMNFMDYSATDKHKTILTRADNAANGSDADAARWASTSAITTIRYSLTAGSFASGSSFALYGIAA